MRVLVTQMLEEPENGFAATTLIDPWVREIVSVLRGHGHDVVHLVGPQDTPENLVQVLQDLNPELYVNYGHGWEDTIIGQGLADAGLELVEKGEVLATFGPLINRTNSELLRTRISYVISCLTAAELGPDAVNKGAAAYFGYRDTFEFGIIGEESAPGYKECANAGLIALLDGSTIGEAFDITREIHEQWMRFYYDQGGSIPTTNAALMKHNRDGLTVLGDLDSRLV